MNIRTLQSSIVAIGTAVPAHKISQYLHYNILESANGLSREEKLHLKKIYSNSGIESRHSVLEEFGKADHKDNIIFLPADKAASFPISERMKLYELFAAELCKSAVLDCFEKIPGIKYSQITHLITFSCTGLFAPGLDIQLVEQLALNRNVERTSINFMGCYAGINALKAADYIVRAQPDAIVLLVGVELCTLHYQKNNKRDQTIANAIFADGASACIVAAGNIRTDEESPRLVLGNFYSEFEPGGKDEMVWRIGDFGFDLRLSAYVPHLIKESIFSLTQKLFEKAKINQDDIAYYALHPGGMKILEACEDALNITKAQNKVSYDVLRNYGNMSSVTIFFVLKEHLKSIKLNDAGKKMLVCAFGPGLTMESLLVEIS